MSENCILYGESDWSLNHAILNSLFYQNDRMIVRKIIVHLGIQKKNQTEGKVTVQWKIYSSV